MESERIIDNRTHICTFTAINDQQKQHIYASGEARWGLPCHWSAPWPQAQTQSGPWEHPWAHQRPTILAGRGRARAHGGGRRQALGRCPGSFWAWLAKDSSDSKFNRLNVDIFQFCYIHLRYILWIPLKRPVNFFDSWTSTGYSSTEGDFLVSCTWTGWVRGITGWSSRIKEIYWSF
jgi:hypothetical protein